MTTTSSCATALASVLLAGALYGIPSARAGMENLETGEKCQGADCFAGDADLPGPTGGGGGSSAPSLPANVTVEDCPSVDEARIGFAVSWLQGHMPQVSVKMTGSDDLMDWPGNSRENFEDKLHKDLKFYCINQKNKCTQLWGRTVPVFAQKRVNLCTANINQAANLDPHEMDALFIHVIAHEIGHLVRLNAHGGNSCSFSDAVGLAAEYAFRGIPYEPSALASRCPDTAREPFDISDKLDSDNREPPLQSLP